MQTAVTWLEGSAKNYKTRVAKLCEWCGECICVRLAEVTGQSNIWMVYTNIGYERLVQTYGFTLKGWPLMQFKSPATVGSIHDLGLLEDALTKKEFDWQEVSDEELQVWKQAAHNAKVAEVGDLVNVANVTNIMNMVNVVNVVNVGNIANVANGTNIAEVVEVVEGSGKWKGLGNAGEPEARRKKQKTSVMVFGDEG